MWALPLNTKEDAALVLKHWTDSMKIPSIAVFESDRGGEFEQLTALGIGKHVKTAAYHFQSNGSIERAHRE
jgi:hypothetical protein